MRREDENMEAVSFPLTVTEPGRADAVLAAALKELIAAQIVNRISYDEIPPRVEYSLTEKGCSVVPILQSICRWAGLYHKEDYSGTMVHCQKCDYRAG